MPLAVFAFACSTAAYLHFKPHPVESSPTNCFASVSPSRRAIRRMRSFLLPTMLNTSIRRVVRQCPNSPIPSRPSTPTPITASFSSRTHQRRQSSSKRPVPPSSSHPAIPAAQVKTASAKNRSETQTKDIVEAGASKEAKTSGTIDVTKKRPGTESRLSTRREARSKKDYSNEWLLSVPSVAPTNHLKREGMLCQRDIGGA